MTASFKTFPGQWRTNTSYLIPHNSRSKTVPDTEPGVYARGGKSKRRARSSCEASPPPPSASKTTRHKALGNVWAVNYARRASAALTVNCIPPYYPLQTPCVPLAKHPSKSSKGRHFLNFLFVF